MRSPLSVSSAAARWRLAALPLCCTCLVVLAFAGLAWRYSPHRSMAVGFAAAGLVAFVMGLVWAFRRRIDVRLSRVQVEGDELHVDGGGAIVFADLQDVYVRDVFPRKS